jgi:hypothetical protein
MNITTRRYPRSLAEAFPCDAAQAVAIHKYKPPLHRRFFYALIRWGWAPLIVLVLLTGCSADHASEWAQSSEIAAVQQEEAAKASREFAGRQVCGPGAVHEWIDDKTVQCVPKRGKSWQVAGVK